MEIVGLEPRRNDLARGIVIARAARALAGAEQRALWADLGVAGITEPGEPGEHDDEEDNRARQWLAAPWLPPATDEMARQREAFERAAASYALEVIWCVKVETGIDGVTWLELAAEEARHPAPADDAPATRPPEEVLYAAPDAPEPAPAEEDDDEDEEDDDEEADDLDIAADVMLESYWRNGAPPMEQAVPFPLERYPEIIDDYDWESFGIALKLTGPMLAGEESVINAFFALWLSVYQDERSDDFEAFQRADVVHDRRHRSALMWVERFNVPATAPEQVHFLMWVVARINEILPISWARFDRVDDAVKSRANGGAAEDDPFILAGNPLADRFRRHGEEAALAWAVGQGAWSRRELAGMLVEVALEHDPDDPATSLVAERLLRRALAFDASSDASGYLAIVLVRQRRLAEAIALARQAPSRDVRLLVVGECAEHMPGELDAALELLDPETLDATEPEELCDLVGGVARHAPAYLSPLLARLPSAPRLVPHLYNTSFSVDKPQSLAILRKVLSLPVPPADAGEARSAYVMAWNNACIHAHALRDYALAVELGEGGQPYGPENPYIYHSAACAYAATGQIELAIAQVAKAIEHEYAHAERMETDPDLAALHADPRFTQLFVEWRARRADLN